MTNFKTDNLALFFGILFAIVTAVAIGSIFTIMSINVIFGTNIPVSMETISAITWLTIAVGGVMKEANNEKNLSYCSYCINCNECICK